jgi:hypothetical protein
MFFVASFVYPRMIADNYENSWDTEKGALNRANNQLTMKRNKALALSPS